MLLAYAYCFGTESTHPELCLIPAKPDQFSRLIRIHSLVPTTNAICRVSPTEGIKVYAEEKEDALVIEAMAPAHLYLTPSQPDRAGFVVYRLRFVFFEKSRIDVYYQQMEKDTSWKQWCPNEMSNN